jgi:hypothetical protein
MLRVMIRDVAGSRRGYGGGNSGDYYNNQSGLSSGKRNTRVVTISSGPMASDAEMAKQINDDDSDKGILDDGPLHGLGHGHHEALKMGRIVQTRDFELKYDTRGNVEGGR